MKGDPAQGAVRWEEIYLFSFLSLLNTYFKCIPQNLLYLCKHVLINYAPPDFLNPSSLYSCPAFSGKKLNSLNFNCLPMTANYASRQNLKILTHRKVSSCKISWQNRIQLAVLQIFEGFAASLSIVFCNSTPILPIIIVWNEFTTFIWLCYILYLKILEIFQWFLSFSKNLWEFRDKIEWNDITVLSWLHWRRMMRKNVKLTEWVKKMRCTQTEINDCLLLLWMSCFLYYLACPFPLLFQFPNKFTNSVWVVTRLGYVPVHILTKLQTQHQPNMGKRKLKLGESNVTWQTTSSIETEPLTRLDWIA